MKTKLMVWLMVGIVLMLSAYAYVTDTFIMNASIPYTVSQDTDSWLQSVSVYNNTWLDFDANGDYVTLSTIQNFSRYRNFSVIIWFKYVNNSANSNIFTSAIDTNDRFAMSLSGSTRNLSIGLYNGSWAGTAKTNESLIHNKIYNLGYVWNNVVGSLYMDLLLITGSATPVTSTQPITEIGRGGAGLNQFNGSIYDLKAYNYPLTQRQIEILYNESVLGTNLGKRIPIIYYHAINETASTGYYITNTSFLQHMQYLYDNGFTSITYADLFNYNNGIALLPEKPIIISFDDNHESVYNYSYILDNFGFVGNWNLITSTIADVPQATLVNISELQELINKGWYIGSHSVNHFNMTNITQENITYQFNTSKQQILDRLGFSTKVFVFPYNEHNSTLLEECMQYYDLCTGWGASDDDLTDIEYDYLNMNYSLRGQPRVGMATWEFDNFVKYVNMEDGQIFSLNLNENTGTTAYDTSGNNNHGTISGATWNRDNVKVPLSTNQFTLSSNQYTLDDYFYDKYYVMLNYTPLKILTTWNFTPLGGGNFSFLADTTASEVDLQDAYLFVNLTDDANIKNLGLKGNLSLDFPTAYNQIFENNQTTPLYEDQTDINWSVNGGNTTFVFNYVEADDPKLSSLATTLTAYQMTYVEGTSLSITCSGTGNHVVTDLSDISTVVEVRHDNVFVEYSANTTYTMTECSTWTFYSTTLTNIEVGNVSNDLADSLTGIAVFFSIFIVVVSAGVILTLFMNNRIDLEQLKQLAFVLLLTSIVLFIGILVVIQIGSV